MSPFFRIRSSSIRRPPRAAPAGQGPRAAGPPRPGRRRREGGLGAHADEEPTQSRGSGAASASAPAPAPRAPRDMECGAAPPPPAPAAAPPPPPPAAFRTRSPTERSPAKSGLHVNFSDKGEVKERREKFLTAKYGSHQMALIRKRLAVEMWLYDELQRLFAAPPRPAPAPHHPAPQHPAPDVDVDIDELLDMESDDQRRTHLAMLLVDAKKPQKDVNNFINELLEKAKTL